MQALALPQYMDSGNRRKPEPFWLEELKKVQMENREPPLFKWIKVVQGPLISMVNSNPRTRKLFEISSKKKLLYSIAFCNRFLYWIIAGTAYHSNTDQRLECDTSEAEAYVSCEQNEQCIGFEPVNLVVRLYLPLIVYGIVHF